MAQAVVKYKTSELINTFSCQDTSNLILCVDPEKVLQPDGFVGTKGYIVAELLSGPTYCVVPSVPDCCTPQCPRYYTYEFVFDNAQLNIGEVLDQCDIFNVIWDQCLIEWVTELAAQETLNTVTDTFSIDLTLSGTLDRNIQADIIVSPFADNVFEVLTNGAFVKEMQTGTGLTNTVGPGTTQTLTLSLPQAPTGRLTLQSLTPVPQSDITPATTLYYTSFYGGVIWLYTAAVWTPYLFSEVLLPLGTLVANKLYDVFLYDASGTLTLEFSAAWADDVTRTDALTRVDGFAVKLGAVNKLHVGTIRTISTTETEDRVANRYVWNRYNQVSRPVRKFAEAVSWTYGTAVWRPMNDDIDNRVSAVAGDLSSSISLRSFQKVDVPGTPAASAISIGIDSTTLNSNKCAISPNVNFVAGTIAVPGVVALDDYVPLGFHFWQALEVAIGGVNVTFYGNDESGLSGSIIM